MFHNSLYTGLYNILLNDLWTVICKHVLNLIFRTLILIALALQPLLCGTWILGLLFLATLLDSNSNPELSEALSWIFTVVNSLQVLLFVVFVESLDCSDNYIWLLQLCKIILFLQGFSIFYLFVVRKKGKEVWCLQVYVSKCVCMLCKRASLII